MILFIFLKMYGKQKETAQNEIILIVGKKHFKVFVTLQARNGNFNKSASS